MYIWHKMVLTPGANKVREPTLIAHTLRKVQL